MLHMDTNCDRAQAKYFFAFQYDVIYGLDAHVIGKFSQRKQKHPITVYPKKYAHGFVVLCFVVVMQSFIMNSHEVFIHIHQGCFAGTVAIIRLPQCQ